MNRIRVLKKRANRGGCGVVRLDDQWYVVSGSGARWVGYLDGPFSRREAIQQAARFVLPCSNKVQVTMG